MGIKWWIGVTAFTVAVGCGATAQAQSFKLTQVRSASEQITASLLITEIYKRAGLSLNIEVVPAARATIMSTNGGSDGEVARIGAYIERNPTLIKVEPPIYHITSSAVAKAGRGIKINSKEDLKKYRVGIVRGVLHAELATAELQKVQIVSTYDSLYQMLKSDRIDVLLDTGENMQHFLQKLSLQGIEPVGDLARLELYHFLAPAHKNIAPKLTRLIKALTDSGELAKLQTEYEAASYKIGVTF